jgi:hypothetical protein
MPVLDHDTKKILLGVGIGLGTALAVPAFAGVIAIVGRPLLKAALKHGALTAERSRERLAVLVEGLEDLVAEVRAEVEEELASKPGGATATAADASAAGTPNEEGPHAEGEDEAPASSTSGRSGRRVA